MKARCIIEFFDAVAKVNRERGEVFDLSPERFNEIIRKGHYIEAAPDDTPEKAAENEKGGHKQ